MNTGFGPFYDGLTHLFLTPDDLLPVIALALLGGFRGPRFGRAVLFALPPAWLLGNATGQLVTARAVPPAVSAAMTVVLGALVAADRALPFAAVVGLAIAFGLINGVGNGIELAKTASTAMGTVGIACGLFVLVSLLAGHVASLRAAWARVVVQIAGSWIAAIGLFMVGWAFK
jgi:urease accessory protein